jgi:ribosome-binding factor A
MKISNIYLYVIEKEKRELVLYKIDLKKGFIRSELAHRIRMKFIPELKFFLDDTLDYVEKIEGLIKKIHENDNNKTNEGASES